MSDKTTNAVWAIAFTALIAVASKVGGGDTDAMVYMAFYFAVRTRLDQVTA